MARFGQALKPSKAPQQLSKASAPHNPPLALPSYLPIGSTRWFYWASKLLQGTFWASLKTFKTRAQPSKALAPHKGPTSCFYWASKLLHGTFWARPPKLFLFSWIFLSLSNFSACTAVHTVPCACFRCARTHAQTKQASGKVGTCAHAASFPCSLHRSPRKTACRTCRHG